MRRTQGTKSPQAKHRKGRWGPRAERGDGRLQSGSASWREGANAPSGNRATEVVIIGGGIMGLGLAWNLAHRGQKNIVVLEQNYLCSGASGRNGGGVRAQWSNETNIELMKESLALCGEFATTMGINVWFRRGGYLFVARTPNRLQQLEASSALQRKLGLPTTMLSKTEMRDVVPQIETAKLLGASYNPDDGVVFPWPFVWGYRDAAIKLGVEVHTHTQVLGLETKNGRIDAVQTAHGRLETSNVFLCAGAESPTLAKSVGVELPTHAHRHEICSSEPLKPFLEPLVGDLGDGLYFSQSARGEIVGGISSRSQPQESTPEAIQQSSAEFLVRYAKSLTELMPVLRGVKVLRQWAGAYDITPDGNPIVGNVDDVQGLFLMSGFMGHGFMMAPVVTEKAAQHFLSGQHTELFARWNLRRFREGKTLAESMILG